MVVSGCSGRPKIRRGLVCILRTRSSLVSRPSPTAVSRSPSAVSRPGKPGGGFLPSFSARGGGARRQAAPFGVARDRPGCRPGRHVRLQSLQVVEAEGAIGLVEIHLQAAHASGEGGGLTCVAGAGPQEEGEGGGGASVEVLFVRAAGLAQVDVRVDQAGEADHGRPPALPPPAPGKKREPFGSGWGKKTG